jgi:transcriptional regulator with XRE-family HTH domain
MASIGDRIKERRLALGWTLDRLACEAKVSKGFLSDLENDRRKTASGDFLNGLARALGVSLDFLVSGGGNLPQGEKVQVPASLAAFAQQASLSFSQTMMLLQLRRQIVAFRSDSKSDDLEKFDWKPFYEDLKAHLK